MKPIRLNPIDTSWVFTESRAAPNHVGGLLQFRLPENASQNYLKDLMADFRNFKTFASPWNRRLKIAFNKNPLPVWVEDDEMDLEYHVRHASLPWPGGERELGELVARLHSTSLDLTRPPWECTVIEGLDDNRFALFIKIHHSLIDGVSGMKLLQRGMSSDRQKSMSVAPFWASIPDEKPHRDHESPTVANAITSLTPAITGLLKTIPQLFSAFSKIFMRIGDTDPGMVVPFMDSPLSAINGRVRQKRRFATQQISIERMRAVASAAHCTLNDVVLAICGGALRSFLLDLEMLPEKSLTAGIPVSIRPKDDANNGNAITFIVATLGTNIADPAKRIHAIRDSVKFAKEHVQSLPKEAMEQYTVMLMAPTMAMMLTGMGGRVNPMYNITISNVPGPDKTLYFRGAELLASYPASVVTHGMALNITCTSYAGNMDFGFTGCHASIPSMQKLAVQSKEAFEALEKAFLSSAKKSAAVKTSTSATKITKKTPAKKVAVRSVTQKASRTKPAPIKTVTAKAVTAKTVAVKAVASKKAAATKAVTPKKIAAKKTADKTSPVKKVTRNETQVKAPLESLIAKAAPVKEAVVAAAEVNPVVMEKN